MRKQWEWWAIPIFVIVILIALGSAAAFIQSAHVQHQQDKAALQPLSNQLHDAKKEIKRLETIIDENR